MKNKIIRFEASLLIGIIVCCMVNISAFSKECSSIRNKLLRMHVIANSDSEFDQSLKLKVRDAVLKEGRELFDGTITASQAQEKILPNVERLKESALSVIESENADYDVSVKVVNEYFKTRTYDNKVTLPAGYYTAVKVVIGEGKGKNWWCVMFPPMCLPAANTDCKIDDVLNEEQCNIVENGNRFKFKFKLVELCQELFKKQK